MTKHSKAIDKEEGMQPSLFDGMEDVRSEKEKISDEYNAFTSYLITHYDLSERYPEVVSGIRQKEFFSVLKKIYTSHVINGTWDSQHLAECVVYVISRGNKISQRSVGTASVRIKKKEERMRTRENNADNMDKGN